MKTKDIIILILAAGWLLTFLFSPSHMNRQVKVDKWPELPSRPVKLVLDYPIHPIKVLPGNGKIVVHEKVDTVFLPPRIDTMQVIQDYYLKRIYEDTLHVGPYCNIFVRDSVTQNKLVHRHVEWMLTQEKNKKKKEHWHWKIGVGLGGGLNSFRIGGKGLVEFRNKKALGLGYYPLTQEIEVSMYWPIGRK